MLWGKKRACAAGVGRAAIGLPALRQGGAAKKGAALRHLRRAARVSRILRGDYSSTASREGTKGVWVMVSVRVKRL